MIADTHRAAALHTRARGLLPLEATVELLINATGRRLLDGPWVRQDDLGIDHGPHR